MAKEPKVEAIYDLIGLNLSEIAKRVSAHYKNTGIKPRKLLIPRIQLMLPEGSIEVEFGKDVILGSVDIK